MGARGVERAVFWVALSLLWGCGGVSTRSPSEAEEASGGTSSSPSGGSTATATGGSNATGGGGETPSWVTDFRLDQFPWFIEGPERGYTRSEMAGDGVLHLLLEGEPLAASVSTHNHFSVVPLAQGVAFRGRASRDVALRVSVVSTLGVNYFEARSAGQEWPSAPAPLTTQWASFKVPFADMRPPEMVSPDAPPAFTVAFIVEERSGPIELWFDDVRFF